MPKTKRGTWFLKYVEIKFVKWLLPMVPSWLETYHLTLMTFGWMILGLLGGFFAQFDQKFLFLISIGVIGQYITDILDGAVGRQRDTGLVKWGFYMDHLLDFCFACSVVVAYWFLVPTEKLFLLFLTFIFATAYFVQMVLYANVSKEFKIDTVGIGPTEIRLLFVFVNTVAAFMSKNIFIYLVQLSLVLSIAIVLLSVCRNQKKLWYMDMQIKTRKKLS